MRIDKEKARKILFEEASKAEEVPISQIWEDRIEHFSMICDATSKTHIAFLGTALLAKAVDLKADAFAVKAGKKGSSSPGAYSARGLGHGVLVPHAPELGISLGVTGREPLNNQPYFQISRVSRSVTVHFSARPALNAVCDILDELQKIDTEEEARLALRTFIHVRRRHVPVYEKLQAGTGPLTPRQLVEGIVAFVTDDSEGGKRAQAVVAGLMDLFFGKDRVVTSRINDPDRHLPGDVGVQLASDPNRWEKIFEVRDKPVSLQDLYHVAAKATENDVQEAAVLAVATTQQTLQADAPQAWAAERDVSLSIFFGWESLLRQVLFWCVPPQHEAARRLPHLVYDRLIELEVSERGVELWISLMAGDSLT